MKKISSYFFITGILIIIWLSISPSKVLAICGSYFGFADPPCVDVDYNPIDPFVVCPNPAVCCSTAPECPIGPPTPTGPPACTPSTQICGGLVYDPGTGQTLCLDLSGACIVPYFQCSLTSPNCCNNIINCPTPTPTPPPIDFCDDYDYPACETDCTPGCTLDAYDCCQEIEPFQPSFCGIGQLSLRTGIGCLWLNPYGFIYNIYRILLLLGGGIALLLMIIGSIFILTSQGQPERIKRGKEIFVGATVGLLFFIFATFLLELIGVDILGLF